MPKRLKSEYSTLIEDDDGEQMSPRRKYLMIGLAVFLVACLTVATVVPVYFYVIKSDRCLGIPQVANSTIADDWCSHLILTDVGEVRRIAALENGDLLMLERKQDFDPSVSFGRIWLVSFNRTTWEYSKTLLVKNAPEGCTINGTSCLNDALVYWKGYIYATSYTTMYRWQYDVGSTVPLTTYEVVVDNMPNASHHTRTIVFDNDNNRFFLAVGAEDNLDPNVVSHSQIRVFNYSLIENNASLPIDFFSGEVMAYGVRNEAGMAMDNKGRLWGVENGLDEVDRPDLGPDVRRYAVGEELNLFDRVGGFYGYPYCWSEDVLPANVSRGVGSQWATPQFMPPYNDTWCEEAAIHPKAVLESHSSPMDMKFYYGTEYPDIYRSVFISRRGRAYGEVGYDIIRMQFEEGNDVPTFWEKILAWKFIDEKGLGNSAAKLGWHRFVGIDWGECQYGKECLYFVSDNVMGPFGGVLGVIAMDPA